MEGRRWSERGGGWSEVEGSGGSEVREQKGARGLERTRCGDVERCEGVEGLKWSE